MKKFSEWCGTPRNLRLQTPVLVGLINKWLIESVTVNARLAVKT